MMKFTWNNGPQLQIYSTTLNALKFNPKSESRVTYLLSIELATS